MTATAASASGQGADANAAENAVKSWAADVEPLVQGTSYLVQNVFEASSGLARDRRVVTMHFTDLTGTQSLQTLVSTLAGNWTTWFGSNAHKITCTAYLSDFAPPGTPHPPLASAISGSSPVIPRAPGEIALCLSYFSTFNVKRNRGRIFIPFDAIYAAQISPALPGPRPSASDQQTVQGVWDVVLKPIDHGGNWDWVLKSRVDKQHKPITDWWVDNEWDTVRRRGLRGDSRLSGTT